jgi:biotin carboxyl carrier protein
MPGQVLSIGVGVGTAVEAGDAIITLEAMKMEHTVTAPSSGTVGDVFIRVGDQVQRGQRLAVVEPR